MNDDSILGSAFGKIGQTVKQVGKQAVKIPEEMVRDAAGQIVGSAKQDADKNKISENKPRWESDEERIKFLKDLYGKSDMSKDGALDSKKTNPNPPTGGKLTEFQEQIKDRSPEEQKKLLELRQQLHKQVYYDPTFNPVKNPPAGQEERPAEKVEKEKKVEMQELQQKEAKKPPPLAVVREQNKAEMFRGVSG